MLTAVALILVIEGALYAFFPDAMKRAMAIAMGQTSDVLRNVGTAVAVLGLVLFWLVRE